MNTEQSTTLSATKRALLAIEQLQRKLDALESANSEPIAIIGIGCRFPGGVRDSESLWEMLKNGTDTITPVPSSRWNSADFYDPKPQTPGKICASDGGFIEQPIDMFDYQFFGLSPREATFLDPQQRMLLEVSWEAFEDAHIVPEQLFNSLTGVFVGIGANDYARHLDAAQETNAYVGTGNALSVAAGRLSYVLGLTGPSLAVDTSCSSSLISVHLACQSLRLRECNLALAGGVNLMLSPVTSIIFSQAGMLAPDSRCKTFDAKANGYVRSEGCGIVVLKRLSDARQDGNRILALIRGSAINQDGPSGGLTIPNGPSQEAVIRSALKNGRINPEQISYIEAHGTGTSLGDPIEVGALGEVFGTKHSKKNPLYIGSIKTNIGHTEFAAGIAGLMKVVLQLRYQAIVPHLHWHQPNPIIDWASLPIRIPTEIIPWLREDTARLAGVSCFGFNGTNGHIVLEESPVDDLDPAQGKKENGEDCHLLTLSAKTEDALHDLVDRYRDYLKAHPEAALADICDGAYMGRSHFKQRLAITAKFSEELLEKLEGFRDKEVSPGVYFGTANGIRKQDPSTGMPLRQASRDGQTSEVDQESIANKLGRLYVKGTEIDWSVFGRIRSRHKMPLPSYPFQRHRCWVETDNDHHKSSTVSALTTMTNHPLLGRRVHLAGSKEFRFESEIRHDLPRYVQYHRVYGNVILPAASFFETALAAGQTVFETSALMLEDVLVQKPLVVRPGEYKALQCIVSKESPTTASFQIFSLAKDTNATEPVETLHVVGKVAVDTEFTQRKVDISVIQKNLSTDFSGEEFYTLLDSLGIGIDPPLRSLKKIQQGENDLFCRYQLPDEWQGENDHYLFHPVLLDGCVQVGGFSCALFEGVERDTYLPFGVERLRYYKSPDNYCLCHSQRLARDNPKRTKSELKANLVILGDDGIPYAEFEGLRARKATPSGLFGHENNILANSFYEVDWRLQARYEQPMPSDFLKSPLKIQKAVSKDVPKLTAETQMLKYPEFLDHLEGLSVSYIVQALQTLGWSLQPGDLMPTTTIVQQLGIVPEHHRLFSRLLQILAEEGILQSQGNKWRVQKHLDCKSPDELVRELQQRHNSQPELDLLASCGEQLSAVLRGACDPLQLIFPEGGSKLATHLYEKSPGAVLINTLVQRSISTAVEEIPGDRGARLLEIGAGTGGTTSHILPHMKASQTDYAFTDLGAWFVNNAKIKFRHYSFVRYHTLDIENESEIRKFEPNRFDIVVAANVLHATTSIKQTLHHIRRLLAPGGILLLLEGTTRQRWIDLIFGLLEGWWKFQDFELRPDYPLLEAELWRQQLLDAGFDEVATIPDKHVAKISLSLQSLIIARSPALSNTPPKPKGWLVIADQVGVADKLANKLGKEGDVCTLAVPDLEGDTGTAAVAVDTTSSEGFEKLLRQVSSKTSLHGVVQCSSLMNLDGPLTQESLRIACEKGCRTTLHLVQGLLKAGLSSLPRIWLATQGAQPVPGNSPVMSEIAQSTLWGLGKVISLEHPELTCTRVDLDPQKDLEERSIMLWAEIAAGSIEDQVAYRNGSRYVARLSRSHFPNGRIPQSSLHPTDEEALPCSVNGTYLITGGLGGLGLLVAKWLVDRGAKHLLLIGRQEASEAAQNQIKTLEHMGATVDVTLADVSDFDALSQVMANVDKFLTPLRGVIHAAGILDDGVLRQQSWERFESVMSPKINGLWNLHVLTQESSLDFFVVFSSAAALFGSPAQGNHAAANAFLDTFAHYRYAQGLPCLSINWSAVAQVGAAAARLSDTRSQRMGLSAIEPFQFLEILEYLMKSPAVNVGVAPIKWSDELREWLSQPFYSDWKVSLAVEREERQTKGHFLDQLTAAPPAERPQLLVDHVRTQVASVLGLKSGRAVALGQGFFEIGMDSLTSVELRNRLQSSLGLSIPSTAAFDYPTVGELVDYLSINVLTNLNPEPAKPMIEQRKRDLQGFQNQRTESPPPVTVPRNRMSSVETRAHSALASQKQTHAEPVAIVGMGCRFPGGADTPADYWEFLCKGGDAITEVPVDRWDLDRYYDPNPETPGKMYVRHGGFVGNLRTFDSHFFGITPREAVSLDPQQRLLLEVSWEALENAAINPQELAKTKTGVFLGVCNNDYTRYIGQYEVNEIDAYLGTGNALSTASGRLSYILGLIGPCLSLDTACSSSLVTIHLACQSLHNLESDIALAGGVNRIFSPEISINFCKGRMLSADGRCKTFDASANGFVRSEGCGMLVLKRLSDAVAANDRVVALIRGSAINQDGRTSGLTVPSGPAQQAVIRQALENAGLLPSDLSYIEAHGTGTSLGDPIELGAIAEVFGRSHSKEKPLVVGSAKTNIGHLEAAAGVVGIMKVALQLQHRQIVPHLHLKQRNPYVDWESLPVQIPTQLSPWETSPGRRIAGVSSFGFSGTNAHIVLEEAPPRKPLPESTVLAPNRPLSLLALSAQTEQALQDLVKRYYNYLTVNPEIDLGDICFSANTGRGHFAHRLTMLVTTTQDLVNKLDHVFQEPIRSRKRNNNPVVDDHGILVGNLSKHTKINKIAFLFSGEGSQYVGMGHGLYLSEPRFREAVDRCDAVLRSEFDIPLLEVLYPDCQKKKAAELLQRADYSHSALFALEYALAQLWQSWGIEPDILLGHGVGEYAAACIAGVFGFEDGIRLATTRGLLIQSYSEGERVVVHASESEILPLLDQYAGRVAITAINGPRNVVLSGVPEGMRTLIGSLQASGVTTETLPVSNVRYSPTMIPELQAFKQFANQLTFRVPHHCIVSAVSGRVESELFASPGHWVDHLQRPIRFSASLETLIEKEVTHCLEIGANSTLLDFGKQCVPKGEMVWLHSIQQNHEDWFQMLQSVSQLYTQGFTINWHEADKPYQRRKVVLPTYPFQRRSYWFEAENFEGLMSSRKSVEMDAKQNKETTPSVITQLLQQGDIDKLVAELGQTGKLSRDDCEVLPRVIAVMVDHHQQNTRLSTGGAKKQVKSSAESLEQIIQQTDNKKLSSCLDSIENLSEAELKSILENNSLE